MRIFVKMIVRMIVFCKDQLTGLGETALGNTFKYISKESPSFSSADSDSVV
jgi:hypothetical protein